MNAAASKTPAPETAAPTREQLMENILALERFQIDIRGAASREEVLRLALRHLRLLLPMDAAGFYFPDAQGLDFEPHIPPEEPQGKLLEAVVEEAMDAGVFGWSLKHPRPAPFKGKTDSRTLILGALRTRQQVMGMFACVVPADYAARWDTQLPALSTSLSILADALLGDDLTRQLQEHNRKLDDLVHQRTSELQRTANELAESHKLIGGAANVTQLLLAPADLNSALHRSMITLGQTTGADRVCFLRGDNAAIPGAAQSIQWLGPDTEADSAPDLPPNDWTRELHEGQILQIQADESAPEDQPWLAQRSIQSLLMIPVITGDVHWGCLRLDCCAKQRRWTAAELSTLTSVSNNMGLAFRRDLHARQLEAAKEAAEVANRAKDRFLATISHELRTPLNAILGYTQSLERADALPKEEAQQIAIIHDSAEHLLTLINDLLDLAKSEYVELELALLPVPLRQIARDVINLLRPRADEKGLRLRCQIEPGVPEMFETDRRRLRQVLTNLIGNAVKFTDSGSVELRLSLSGPAVRFQVSDTGCGMTPEELAKLFRPFQQVGNLAHRQEGSGLGLAISGKIVEALGGKLQVESQAGKGSTFWFELALPAQESAALKTTTGEVIGAASADLGTPPDPERLQHFQELLARGDILELQQQAAQWQSQLPVPNPFASHLIELAGAFRIKALRQLLNASTMPVKEDPNERHSQ